jgi:hypothetical protein
MEKREAAETLPGKKAKGQKFCHLDPNTPNGKTFATFGKWQKFCNFALLPVGSKQHLSSCKNQKLMKTQHKYTIRGVKNDNRNRRYAQKYGVPL